MAEEAVGLAKSLGWTVEYGPKAAGVSQPQEENTQTDDDEDTPGRRFGSKRKKRRLSVEGEELVDGDYVAIPGTGFKGWYRKGGLEVDVDSLVESESDVEDEWTDESLRERIALTSIVKMREERATTFFGAGKVRELGEFIASARPSVVFVNHALSSLQRTKLEK